MDKWSETVYNKLWYIHEHSGDGAIIHEAGHLSGLIFNYSILVEKETANPIMGPGKLDYYKEKLEEYTIKGICFLVELAEVSSCVTGNTEKQEDF